MKEVKYLYNEKNALKKDIKEDFRSENGLNARGVAEIVV